MASPSRGSSGDASRRGSPRKQKDPELVELGLRIRKHRRDAGLTQFALAVRTEMHPATIGHVEQGTQNSGLINLVRLARGLDLTVAELIAGPDSVPRRSRS